jgi:hypothetical protein
MKRLAILVGIMLAVGSTAASAQYYQQQTNPYAIGSGSNPNSHPVQGYTTHNGTYVAPHYQTNPNNTQMDNYGTRGNVNPYTGQIGTRSPRY